MHKRGRAIAVTGHIALPVCGAVFRGDRDHHLCDLRRAVQRTPRRTHLGPAIGQGNRLRGQQGFDPVEILRSSGSKETGDQVRNLRGGRFEPRPGLLHAAAGAADQLAAGGFGFVQRFGKVAIVGIEHVAQDQGRTFSGVQPLHRPEQGQVAVLRQDVVLFDRLIGGHHQRFRQPWTDIGFPPGPGRP